MSECLLTTVTKYQQSFTERKPRGSGRIFPRNHRCAYVGGVILPPCLPVFVSSVFPEPRDPGSWLQENTPGYCFITLLIGPGLIPQAPRNRAWQITKGRSLHLSLVSFRWGWRSLKGIPPYIPFLPNGLQHLRWCSFLNGESESA